MTARRALVTGVLLAALLGTWTVGCSRRSDAGVPPRNVLIVVLDTLRADHLGSYGYARSTSSELDAYARDGFVFESAQSAAPWTTPSLISLMTSLYPDVHQVRDWPAPGRLSPNVTTLATLLKQHGLDTAAFTEGVYAKGQFGLDQGFDYFPPVPGEAGADPSTIQQESRIESNVARTLEWIRDRGERPFFAFFHTYEVHSPYRASPELVRLMRPEYDEAADYARLERILTHWNQTGKITREDCEFFAARALLMSKRASWRSLPPIVNPLELRRQTNEYGLGTADLLRRPEVLDLARDLYDAGIVSADRAMARLFAGLRELGHDDDTLVVIVSDHGEGLGEHGQMEHGHVLRDEILRVVMILRVPGHEQAPERGRGPKRIGSLAQLVDVAPTVLELLGIDARKQTFQGRSLVPAMRGEAVERPAFSHGRTMDKKQDARYSVRTSEWRLDLDLSTQVAELFDLVNDPHELVDVAARKPEIVERLSALLRAQHERDANLRKSLASEALPSGLDAEMMEELRHLGYVGGADHEH